MTKSKFYQEINSHLERNPNWEPYIGKAKIKQGVDLWPGKWKKIIRFDNVGGLTLEDKRTFKINEIEEFRLTTEFLSEVTFTKFWRNNERLD
tara:strand:- start:2560 stop:2835 length:276 start_codon:yes stop_codon:yes gene_type:complete